MIFFDVLDICYMSSFNFVLIPSQICIDKWEWWELGLLKLRFLAFPNQQPFSLTSKTNKLVVIVLSFKRNSTCIYNFSSTFLSFYMLFGCLYPIILMKGAFGILVLLFAENRLLALLVKQHLACPVMKGIRFLSALNIFNQ